MHYNLRLIMNLFL